MLKGNLPALALIVLLALSAFVLPLLFQVDVPEHDQWDLAPAMVSWSDGDIRLGDIWEPYGEHMMFLPRLLMLAAGAITRWNMLIESFLSSMMLLAAALLLRRKVRGDPAKGTNELILGLAAVSMAVLAPNRSEVFMWTWQMQVSMALLFTVSSLLVLSGRRSGILFSSLAALLAGASSLSFGAGLAVWPAGLVIILRRRGPAVWKGLVPWIAAGCLVALLYSFDVQGSNQPSSTALPAAVLYGLTFLGAPLFTWCSALGGWGFVISALAGVFVLYLYSSLTRSLLIRHRNLERDSGTFWISLGTVSVTAAFLAGWGRSSQGFMQALSLRYVPFSSLIWLAVYMMSRRIKVGKPKLRRVLAACAAALVLLSSFHGIYYCAGRMNRLRQVPDMLRQGCYSQAAPRVMVDEGKLRRYSELLRSRELSVFR